MLSKTHENQTVGWDFEGQRAIAGRIVHRVSQFAKIGKWLDVGFGNGALLFAAEEYGYDCDGIDIRAASVKRLITLGFRAYSGTLVDYAEAETFDVISLADVLEHVPFPIDYMVDIFRRLNPGGVVFLSMPNSDSVFWRLSTENNTNPYWGELEHYHNFGQRTIRRILGNCGFEVCYFGFSERYRLGMEIIARKPQ